MAVKAPAEAFSERLNLVLDESGVPPKGSGRQLAIAKRFDVSQKGARRWLEGESFPEMHRAIAIAGAYDVCVEWLLTGSGPKHPGAPTDPDNPLSDVARRYKSAAVETQVLVEVALGMRPTVTLPGTSLTTLRQLLEGVRNVIANHTATA